LRQNKKTGKLILYSYMIQKTTMAETIHTCLLVSKAHPKHNT